MNSRHVFKNSNCGLEPSDAKVKQGEYTRAREASSALECNTMRSDTDIQNLFQDLYQRRDDLNAPEYFHYFTKSMAEGLWKDYEALLVKFPGSTGR